MAARYSRPALPTSFNDLVRSADPNDKIRKKMRAANEVLSGVYVQLIPNSELKEGETYQVNLLGLIPSGKPHLLREKASISTSKYADLLRDAGMEVTYRVMDEGQVSIDLIKGFTRVYFDDLSFRDESPLPPLTL